MRAYLLEGPSMTAHELLAAGVDVVVCSYDQVEASDSNNPSFPHPRSLQGKDHKFAPLGLGRKSCNIFRMEEEG